MFFADFPRLQPAWKMRQQGAKRVGETKERCGFSPASAGMENATAGSEASRRDEGTLQHSLHSFLRLRLRCPFCLADRLKLSGQKGVFPRLQPAWNSPLFVKRLAERTARMHINCQDNERRTLCSERCAGKISSLQQRKL